MRSLLKPGFVVAGILILLVAQGPGAIAAKKTPTGSITWTGQGTHLLDESRTLNLSLCGTENGAPVDGDYFTFVLASTKNFTTTPKIKFGSDSAVFMTKSTATDRAVSSYKYTYTGEATLEELIGLPVVASDFGTATPTLTLAQGCVQDDTSSSLTITFLGELVSPTAFGALGAASAITPSVEICEDSAGGSCVTFAAGSAAGSSKSLTLSDALSHPLKVTISPLGMGESVYFHGSSVTAANAGTDITDTYTGVIFGTQSAQSYSNGDTLWFHATYSSS